MVEGIAKFEHHNDGRSFIERIREIQKNERLPGIFDSHIECGETCVIVKVPYALNIRGITDSLHVVKMVAESFNGTFHDGKDLC